MSSKREFLAPDAAQTGEALSFSADERDQVRRMLLDWYDQNRRDLPWRDERDPYLIWVSEVMLQQTQAITVIDYYQRWVERFPTVETLARAPLDDVLGMWAGLGYYRRARFLHESARHIVENLGAELPDTVKELKKLKGIGPYTAGAIASIAFSLPAPLVDGNVERVFSRLRAISGDPKARANQKVFWRLAEELVDPARPGDFNQGLMELGATVCSPHNPECERCPLKSVCRAYKLGAAAEFPRPTKRISQRDVHLYSAIITRPSSAGDEFFLIKRPLDGIWGGLWEFPSAELSAPPTGGDLGAGRREIRARLLPALDEAIKRGELDGFVHHFTHLKLHFWPEIWATPRRKTAQEALSFSALEGDPRPSKWATLAALKTMPISAAMQKLIEQLSA